MSVVGPPMTQPSEHTRAFAGWLGLAAALEHFLDAQSETQAAGADPVVQPKAVT